MDANEDLQDHTGKFTPLTFHPDKPTRSKTHDGTVATLLATCGLVDPLAKQHRQRPLPATYIRGKKRLDGIFISSQVLSAVKSSGILPYHSIFF
jgi:hypothetical protein